MKGYRSLFSRFLILFVTILSFLLSPIQPAFATFSDLKINYFAQNNIFMYSDECAIQNPGGMQNCTAVSGNNITWIGDSYSTGSQSIIENQLPGITFGGTVNTDQSTIQACKFVDTDTTCNSNPTNPSGIKVLESIIAKNELKPYLVFALGTNGGWSDAAISAFQATISKASGTKVVFVTSKTPSNDFADSNNRLKALADSNPNYSLADWTTVYDTSFFDGDPEKIHPVSGDGYKKWVEIIYNALPRCTGGAAGDGDFSHVLTAKNADKSFFNGSGDVPSANWSDTDTASMKQLLETYGDLAYQLGRAIGAPYIAILVQMRYEDANSVCGKNNFWGNGCPPGTGEGGASIQGANLGEGFKQYGETLLNTSLDGGKTKWYAPALGISDPKQYLRTLGPLWVQGDPNGEGYSTIADEEASIDALTNYINSSDGQAIVKTFGNYYYDGGINTGNSSGGSSLTSTGSASLNSSGDAVNYRGDTVFTADELKKIGEHQAVYEEAVKGTSLPWQVLAAIHNNENSLSLENPSNGQGIFQFYSRVQAGETFPSSGTADQAEFLRQAKLAVEDFVRDTAAGGYDVGTEQGIMYGFFAYNGIAQTYITQALKLGFSQEEAKVGAGSPYVMNRYDEKRDPSVEPTKSNGTWGQIKTDNGPMEYPANLHFGAYVQFAALAGGNWSSTGGVSGASSCYGSVSNGNGGASIAAKARELAWPDDDSSHYAKIKPEFAEAAKKFNDTASFATNLSGAQDCGHFVAVVVKNTVDPDFPAGGTPNMEEYMHKSPLWQELTNEGNESNLQPGDVFVANTGSGGYGSDTYPSGGFGGAGHIYIYLGGSDITASASYLRRTGNLKKPISYEESYGKYRIFRSTVQNGSTGGTVGTFDEGLKAIETSKNVKVGAAVTAMGNDGSGEVQIGGSWTGGRAWSTIKVPLAIAALQKNASTGSVTEPYGTSCSGPISTAVETAITRSDNCGAWWLWQALGGDNSSAASSVDSVLSSGKDSSTKTNGSGDGNSLTSGKTSWALTNQAIFASNLPSLSSASTVLSHMNKSHKSGDDSGWGILTIGSNSWAKGGWGSDATRQFGIVKWSSGKCSAVAIGTDAPSNFSIANEIAQVLLDHQDEVPSGTCPSGL